MVNFKKNRGRPKSKQTRPVAAKMVYKGKIFEVWQWEQLLFDGSKTIFETLRRRDMVRVLPILSDGNAILAEESQPGMPLMLRTFGGGIEPDESSEAAAHRELLEESGYIAKELRLWDVWQPEDKIDCAVYLYVAHDLSGSGTQIITDPSSKINFRILPVSALLEQNSNLIIDDFQFLHKLYFARSDEKERQRVLKLLIP